MGLLLLRWDDYYDGIDWVEFDIDINPFLVGLREEEPQSAFRMSFAWAFHIALSMLTEC